MGIGTLLPLYDPTAWFGTYAEVIDKGLALGQKFIDKRGFTWQLHELETDLNNDKTAAGEALVYKDPENWLVTNKNANAFTIAGQKMFAGIVAGAFDESKSATDKTLRKVIFLLIDGIFNTVKTNGDDNIVEGDIIIVDAIGNGTVDSLALAVTDPTADASVTALKNDLVTNTIPSIEALFSALEFSAVGWAIDDDIDVNNTVKTWVKKRR